MLFLTTIVIGFLILDTIFLGFTLWVLKISPSYRHFLKDKVILYDKVYGYQNTLDPSGYYHGIILTPKNLILRQNHLTSLVNIKIDSIESFSIKKPLLASKKSNFILHLRLGIEDKIFKFRTRRTHDWLNALSELGIKLVDRQGEEMRVET